MVGQILAPRKATHRRGRAARFGKRVEFQPIGDRIPRLAPNPERRRRAGSGRPIRGGCRGCRAL